MKPFLPKPLLVRAGHSRQSSGGSSGSSGSSNKSSATASSKLSASPTPSYSTYASLSPKSQVLAFRLDADAHPAPPLPPAVRIQEEQLARPLPPSPVSAPAMLYQRKAEVAQRRYDQLHAEYENLERRCNYPEDTVYYLRRLKAALDMRDKAVMDEKMFVNRECRRVKESYDDYLRSEDMRPDNQF